MTVRSSKSLKKGSSIQGVGIQREQGVFHGNGHDGTRYTERDGPGGLS